MTYEDWVINFDQIQICNISPDTLRSARSEGSQSFKWNSIQFDGEWINGRSAGGCGQGYDKARFWTNVKYFFKLK